MKANVIEGCISCGLCASVCPEVFRMNDENVSEVYHQPTPEQEDATQEAADGCPVSVCSCQVRNKKKLIFFINGEPLARFPMLLLYNFVFSLLLLIIPSSSLKVIKVPSDFNMLIIIHQHIINEISDYFFIKLIQLTKLC